MTGLLRDTGLRHIWQHRNRTVCDDQKVETLSVFEAKLKQKVTTEFQIAKATRKIETFTKNWAHHNLLTEIQNTAFLDRMTTHNGFEKLSNPDRQRDANPPRNGPIN